MLKLLWVDKFCSGTVVLQLPLVHVYCRDPVDSMTNSDGVFTSPCDGVTVWLATFAIPRQYLYNQTCSTKDVATAEFYWLICDVTTDDAKCALVVEVESYSCRMISFVYERSTIGTFRCAIHELVCCYPGIEY